MSANRQTVAVLIFVGLLAAVAIGALVQLPRSPAAPGDTKVSGLFASLEKGQKIGLTAGATAYSITVPGLADWFGLSYLGDFTIVEIAPDYLVLAPADGKKEGLLSKGAGELRIPTRAVLSVAVAPRAK